MSFFVIEGLDGSGKSTQIIKLQEYFHAEKILYKYIHFPRTDAPVYGDLIAKFLRGDLGKIGDVDPYLVALIYAGDRMDAAASIRTWQAEGQLVMVDRYVSSNIAFQCAKISDKKKKTELSNWILNLEYNYNKIPKPQLTLFLDVPFEFTRKQLSKTRYGADRDYLKGAKDIHEESLDFQQRVKEAYINHLETDQHFIHIDCKQDEQTILPAEDIFNKIIYQLKHYNIIK